MDTKNGIENADKEMIRLAARDLRLAAEDFDKACDSVSEAMTDLLDTVEGDRLSAVLADMENTLKDIRAMQAAFEEAAGL